LKSLEEEMLAAAQNLEFERAARLRDKIVDGRDRIGELIDDEEDSKKDRRSIGRQRKRSSSGAGKRIPKPRKN
jgi:excinuclease ABC subunit B